MPVGVGGSREAAYTGLPRPLPAGIWTLYGDAMVVGAPGSKDCTARWEIIWRPKAGGNDVVLASFRHTYVVDQNQPFNAIKYTDGVMVPPANILPEDTIILRWTNEMADQNAFFEPNGDGMFRAGVLPHLDLPM